jgi:MHS family alpha-ketoglutarate permease-like MFS transporter
VLAALVALMLMQPLGGALSDRIGRKPLLIAFGALGFVGAGVLVTVAAQVTSPPAVMGILVLAFAVLTC